MEDYLHWGGYQITLNDGTVIQMKKFDQLRLPRFHKAGGDFEIIPGMNGDTYLIYLPIRTWPLYENFKHTGRIATSDLENPPVTYPRIQSTAFFESWRKLDRSDVKDHDFSMLNVCWYQDDWGFDIGFNVMERIKALDWQKLASPCWI